eukprot:tig00000147_g9508.t1
MVKYDLRKGYYHIALHPATQRLLTFRWRGRLYVYQALCFGVNVACRVFTKLMRAFAKYWAALGHLRWLAPQLGLVFSSKSDFTPTQVTEYLGLEIDTRPGRGVFTVTPKKVAKITALLDEALASPTASVRALQRLAGKLIALRMAFPAARLMTRPIFAALAAAERTGRNPFDPLAVQIDGAVADALNWMRRVLPTRPHHPIWEPLRFFRLFTDASGYGFAAFLDCGEGATPLDERQGDAWSTWGTFPPELRAGAQPPVSSNERELRAVLAAARDLFPLLPFGAKVFLRSDNSTTVAAVGKGSASPRLFDLCVELWRRCAELGIILCARHIPGVRNRWADTASRSLRPQLHRGLLAAAHAALGAGWPHEHVADDSDVWLAAARPQRPAILTADSRLRARLLASLRDHPPACPVALLLPWQPSTTWAIALSDLWFQPKILSVKLG